MSFQIITNQVSQKDESNNCDNLINGESHALINFVSEALSVTIGILCMVTVDSQLLQLNSVPRKGSLFWPFRDIKNRQYIFSQVSSTTI